MMTLLRTLGRTLVVGLSFMVAAAVAGFVLVTLGIERVTHVLHGSEGADGVAALIDVLRNGLDLLAAATLVPAVLLIVVGEVARIRASLFYILGGGAVTAAIPLLARLGQSGPMTLPPVLLWQVFATAGFAGGLVYWMLAGRKA